MVVGRMDVARISRRRRLMPGKCPALPNLSAELSWYLAAFASPGKLGRKRAAQGCRSDPDEWRPQWKDF
jgi:hypothetical protein